MPNEVDYKKYLPNFPKYRDTVRKRLDGWVMGSIKCTYEATKDGESSSTPLAAYLLLSCAIDMISGFYAGRTDIASRNGGQEYREFVRKYLPMYPPDSLYKGLRCYLAHNYVLRKEILLTHRDPNRHLRTIEDGRKVWNFENMMAEFQEGIKRYFAELESSNELKIRFIRRFKAIGIADTLSIDTEGHIVS